MGIVCFIQPWKKCLLCVNEIKISGNSGSELLAFIYLDSKIQYLINIIFIDIRQYIGYPFPQKKVLFERKLVAWNVNITEKAIPSTTTSKWKNTSAYISIIFNLLTASWKKRHELGKRWSILNQIRKNAWVKFQ